MLRKIGLALCFFTAVFCLSFGLAPVFYIHTMHAGMVGMLLYGAALLALLALWRGKPFVHTARIQHRLYYAGTNIRYGRLAFTDDDPPRWWRICRGVWAGLLGLFAAAGAAISVCMLISAYLAPPGPTEPYTVVVLGCQVVGEEPSLMLRRRLDAAYDYLSLHPESPVVVSGGLDRGKTMSEAAVMKKYLVSRGIPEERIYLEERSTSTQTNLSESAKVIAAHQLPRQTAIASDGFHILRGRIYAAKNGLSPSASLPASTPWGLRPGYWVREWFAVLKALILD